jgi:hypothetical protein
VCGSRRARLIGVPGVAPLGTVRLHRGAALGALLRCLVTNPRRVCEGGEGAAHSPIRMPGSAGPQHAVHAARLLGAGPGFEPLLGCFHPPFASTLHATPIRPSAPHVAGSGKRRLGLTGTSIAASHSAQPPSSPSRHPHPSKPSVRLPLTSPSLIRDGEAGEGRAYSTRAGVPYAPPPPRHARAGGNPAASGGYAARSP